MKQPDERGLLETESFKSWLSQFDTDDRNSATEMVMSLRLVSVSDFTRAINQRIEAIAAESRERPAAFAIRKLAGDQYFLDQRTSPKRGALTGRRSGSEAIVENIISGASDRKIVFDHPPIAVLRKRRIHHAIVVDDLIGSGERVRRFLKKFAANASIKSWRSYGLLHITTLAFAASERGVTRALSSLHTRTYPRDGKNLHALYCIRPTFLPHVPEREGAFRALADKYAHRGKIPRRYRFGFADSMAGLVFEHKCPNNTPGILWYRTHHWQHPLFPDQQVPQDLRIHFGSASHNAIQLQYNTQELFSRDLSELERIVPRESELVVFIEAIRRMRKLDRVENFLGLTHDRVEVLLRSAREGGLIGVGDVLTDRGLRALTALRSAFRGRKKAVVGSSHSFYFPGQ